MQMDTLDELSCFLEADDIDAIQLPCGSIASIGAFAENLWF